MVIEIPIPRDVKVERESGDRGSGEWSGVGDLGKKMREVGCLREKGERG